MSDPQQGASRRLQHLSQVQRGIHRRRRNRALTNSVLTASEHSDDPYLSKLAKTSRRVPTLGVNGQEFFKSPGAYQFMLERDDSDPDGFLDRMASRARDGDLLNQRGRVGFAAMMGNSDIDAALKQAEGLRGQMSSGEWLQRQSGLETQLGFAVEMVGQQARNVPTALLLGATALGTGLAVGSVGGPAGALAGGLGAFGFGATVGMAVENTQMLAGLSFLDLMEEPLRLPDGTEARMPIEVARGVGLAIGAVQGALETAQVASVFGMVPGARQLANKAISRLIATGKVREIAVRFGSRIAAGTGENVLEEMLQELTGMVGTEVALNMVRDKTGAERVEAKKFADEFWMRMGEVAKMAPAFGILSGPQAAIGSVVAQHRASPDRMFDSEGGGEIVPIDNLVIPEAVNERQRATTTALIEQARLGTVRLPAIRVARDEDGKLLVATPDQQAMVAGLRANGIRAVRVMDEAVVAAEEEAAALAAPAAEGEPAAAAAPAAEEEMKPKARKGPVAIRSMSAFEAVQEQFLVGTAGTEITPEQATIATITLERMAQSQGKDLMTVAQEWFQDKIFADKETTARIMDELVEEAEPDEPPPPVDADAPESIGPEVLDTEPEPVTEPIREESVEAEVPADVAPELTVPTEPTAEISDAEVDDRRETRDQVVHEPTVPEPPAVTDDTARMPGQDLGDWWREFTPEGRRLALRQAGFNERDVERIHKTDFNRLQDVVVEVLEREFPDQPVGIPDWARENFAQQQDLMRRQPGDIGKARREGTLTQRQERALEDLDRLRERLPQESDLWQQIMQEGRERYDTELAEQRAATRTETEGRMVDAGWSVGDKVWLPEVNMLTGQVLHRQQGTVKINKAGGAYVAGAGKQFSLFDNQWTRVGEEATAAPPARPEAAAAQVEPSAFTEIPEMSGDKRDSSGIAVWEGNDGNLEVLAGFWRAKLAQSYQERSESAFSVPALRYREADGVTLEQARAHALTGLDEQKERELLPTVRFLRKLPIDDQLESVSSALPPSLPIKDLETVIGLNSVDDEVFAMVERGDLKMEHAAPLGRVTDAQDQIARALAMSADPPQSQYEAELRAGHFGFIDPDTGAAYPGETATARLLAAVDEQIEDKPRDPRVKAIVEVAESLTLKGAPLHERFREMVARHGPRRGAVVRAALPVIAPNRGFEDPYPAIAERVESGEISIEVAADQTLTALGDALAPPARPAPAAPTPERVQEVTKEVVTWKKARIVPTEAGVVAVPIEDTLAAPPPIGPDPSVPEQKDLARARLREKLSLERIDSSMQEKPAPPTPAPIAPAPESRVAPAQTAYQETTKGITQPMVTAQGTNPFEVSNWDGYSGWAMGAGMFRTEKFPAVVSKLMPVRAEPRDWEGLREMLGVNPDIAWDVVPVASEEVVMSGAVTRPVVLVKEVGGDGRDAFFDDRYLRYIRVQFKGQARLQVQSLVNRMLALIATVDGKVVAVVPQLVDKGHEWTKALRAKADQAAAGQVAPESEPEAAPKPRPRRRKPAVKQAAVNPTPETAPAAPPVPRQPVKVENASKTELLDGLEAMFDDEDAETDILYSDGAAAPSKMARIIQRLVEVLMIDEGYTDFPSFATSLMQAWGNRRNRDRVFVAMRDWYEAGREADVAPDMTAPPEIDTWYEENADVVDRDSRTDDRGKPEAEGRPDAGRGDGRPGPVDADERAADGGDVSRPGREREPDAAARGARDRDRADEGRDRERDGIPPSVESTENWHFAPGELDATETRGPSQKARDNVAALELLKTLQTEGRQATPDEQAVLAKYVGWGGLKTVFPDPGTGAFGKGMEDVGARLLELLTEDEYAAARRSIQYAHYTSETVISFMWRMAQTLGFTGGRVIEPGAGVGHFAGMMPGELIKGSTYFGIEMDPTTAAIAGQLYPHWTLRQQDYSRTAVPPDLFDLAIGNPPFANFRPADPKYDKHKFLLHDYFFAKTLDGVRPGGIMAFVTSAGTMNKQNAKARQYIADRADFIGAARLPNTAFKANAGTEVTTDVLFFRRRKSGAPENHVSPWVESVETDMPTRTGDTAKGYVNQYFIDNPEMVLGDPGLFDELVAGLRYSVRQRPGASLEADLTRAGARLIEQAPAVEAAPAGAAEGPGAIEMLTQEMKDGSYYLNDDGELLQFRMGAGRAPTRPGASGKLVKMSKKDQQMVRDLLPVRDAYREVLAADLGDDTDVADAARAKLNLNYDSFVDQYGPIRKTTTTWRKVKADELETLRQQARERARSLGDPWDEGMFDDALMVAEGASKAEIARARQAGREVAAASGRPFTEGSFDPDAVAAKPMTKMPNLQPFLGDPEAYRVMALEMGFDEDTGVAERSEVFERNIIRRQPEAKIETALDGMLHVLTTTGQFDIGAISAASNRSEQETWKELGDLTYHDPSLGEWMMAEEYLSGNVVLKLQQARAEALANPDYARNVGALEAVQPKKVGPGDIAVKVGSAWIPTEVYEAFATEVLQADFAQVTHNVELNLWNVEGYATQSGIAEYGAHNQVGGLIYGPTRIMQELLRAKILKAPRFRDADGSSHADTEGDIKVAEAIKHMQEAFGRWIWSNPARTESLVDLYNGKFNTTVEREYRTDYITTPGVADWWQWRNHQLRGIARIIVAGNTYLNHAVGSGKTSTMIAAAMELRRLGKVRKPLFVVPNHMLAQFGAEWYQLYPTANLMIADEANFHTSRRKRFVAEAGTGDYDAVIMTYDALGLVPISDTFAEGIIKEEIQKFVEGLTEVEDRFTRKRLEESIERLEKQLTRGARRKRDQVFTFEELGVDMLFTDEAQKYRKLGFSTAQGSVKGIDNTGGPTTMDFYIKTRYIESINPGRGLVFASGTPVTNTLSEIFSLQRFMDTPGLKEHGIEHFDAWASTFGAVEEEPERDVAGALKYVERFTGIPNAPELSRLVRSFMDVVTPEQLHEHVTVPAYRGGGREKVMIEQSGEQEWHHGTVVTRLEQAKTDKKFSEILKLINEARLAAIDPRLLPPGELLISDAEAGEAGAPEVGEGGRPVWSGRGSKLNQAIDNIYRIWQETTDQPFYTLDENGQYSDEPAFRGPATQIVFSPLGFTVEKGRLHLPTYMRQELMNRGIPGHQIAYMGDFKSHDKKKRLFNDMNEGKVRILIGSERNMGTGVNVQRRLAVEHNLAPVWFPADDEQRVGRILRQGNLNREVGVMDYSTVGSYDYAMWQMMSRKGRAIERFFRGDPELRFVGDIGEHAHYGQMMALTAEDPRLLQMVELQNELTKAEREKAASDDRVWNKRYAVKALDDRVQIAQQAEEHLDKAIAKRIDAEYKGDGWRMILGGRVIDDRAEAAQELSARWNAFVGRGIAKGEFNGDFGTFAGFNLVGSFMRFASGHIHNPQIALEMDGTLVIGRNLAEDEISDPGPLIVRSLSQRLAGLEKQRTEAQATNAAAGTERERLQADLDATPAVGWERVEELRAAHKQLETDIRAEAQTREAPAVDRPAAQPAPSINPMAEAMAEAHGVETIEAAGYVLRDGRMAAPPEGSTDALQTIRATDTAWVDTRSHIVRAEGPLSQVQMATIVEQLGGAPARLIHTKDGRELMNMQSKDGLTVETLRTAFPAPAPEVLQQGRVGAVQFDQAGKALIALTASADFDTLMEEMAHVFRRHLTGDQENAVAEWAGASLDAETGRWSWGRGAEEVFARGFVDWLREGVVPNDAVLSVFERARQWLRQIYAGVRSELNPQVRRVFEDMVLLHDYPEVQAFERAVGELEGMEKEALFTDGRQRRLRVQRSGRAYTVDAHDAEGRQLFMRQYGDIADAAREIAGVPTIENPTPAGSRDMRMERPDERAAREREAELRIASDDLQLQDMAAATGTAETQVLYQERGDEDPRRQQRLRNLAEGRKTQLLNRLAEMGVDPGDITPWNKKPLRELSMEDLRTVYQQMVQQRADGRQETARKYERRELVRYGRNRVRQIQASLQRILRDTKRMPAELRDPLRKLLTDLDLVRVGRTEAARMEVAEPETDPLRLLGTLQAAVAGAFDPEQRPPGTLEAQDIAGKRLAQLSVLELERLHNTIAYIGAEVAKAQAGLQAGYRKTANRVANEVVRDLRRAPPLRQNMAGRAVTHFLGERPGFLLERIGGGLDSTLYETLWKPIIKGAQNKRRLIRESAGRYHSDMRRAGMTMNRNQLAAWLRQRIDVPEWASEMHRWTRADLMSLALMWRDPYARRNLVDLRSDPAEIEAAPYTGGLVFTKHGRQSTDAVQVTQGQVLELIALLGEQERRFLGSPVRNMFNDLFRSLNAIFREKYGYDLEQAPDYFPVEVAATAVPDSPESGGAVDFYRAQEAQGSAEPFQGMIQWRTGAVKPMVLRPVNTVINRSLDRAATYVGLELPLTAARRLMARRDVTATMRDRWGQDVPQVINRYLRDMAGSGEVQDGLERALMQLKRNVSVGSLGLSAKVALSQSLSLPLYAIHVPGKYLAQAVGEMASPRASRRILERHTVMDPDFAERSEYGFDPDVETGRMFTGRGVLPADRGRIRRLHERATNILMTGIRATDRFTVARGEQAAVHHALDVFAGNAPMTEDLAAVVRVSADQAQQMSVEERMQLAYEWANWVTGRTQPSFLPEHMSAFARGKVTKFFSSFSGYTNVAFNALRRAIRVAREGRFRDAQANRGALLAVMSIMVIGPLGVTMLAHLRSLAQGEDEPDPIWKGVVQGNAALVYGVKDVSYYMSSGSGRAFGMDNPTAAAVKDMIVAGDSLGRAVFAGDQERIESNTEQFVAAGLRMVGVPYWTPKNWVEAAMEGLD